MVPLLWRIVVGVDLAITEKQTSDFTVAFAIGYGVNGRYYFFRPYCERVEAPEAEDAVAAYARNKKANMIAVESVAYQLSFVQHLRKMPMLAGIPIQPVQADRDKVARARGWTPFARDGLIVMVDDGSGWIETWIDTAVKFPKVKKDDKIDAPGIAFAGLREIAPPAGALVGGPTR
jgi:predicted phage terminase large subunit-like protein